MPLLKLLVCVWGDSLNLSLPVTDLLPTQRYLAMNSNRELLLADIVLSSKRREHSQHKE
jgi:hypothetical protein